LPKYHILQAGYRWQTEGYNVFTFDENKNNVTLSHHYLGANASLTYRFESANFSIIQDIQYKRRPPNVAELYSQGLHHGAAAIEYGNSNLQPENVFSLQQTMQIKPCKVFQISILPYYYNIHNFIYLQPRPEPIQTIRGAYFAYDYRQSNVQILGLDIRQKITLLSNKLYWHSNFASNRSFITNSKSFLPYMPQTHLSNALELIWQFRKNMDKLNINLGYDYFFEKSRYTPSFEVIQPPNGYGLLNFDVTVNCTKNVHSLTWNFGIHNLLNTTYRSYTDRFRYFSDASGVNFIISLIYSLNNHKK
jgi:iron complex outermembrane receptor protein